MSEEEIAAVVKHVMEKTKHVNRPLVSIQLIASIILSVIGIFAGFKFLTYIPYRQDDQEKQLAAHEILFKTQEARIATVELSINHVGWQVEQVGKDLKTQNDILRDIQQRPWNPH